jgi:type IV secretion system protein VirD4
LFLGGKEESTLKSISEQLGKETIDIVGKNRTKARQSSTSENNSIVGRELMQPNEISTMPISDCILLIRSHNPFYCKKYPLGKHPNYGFLAAAAETAEEFEERSFQISSIHAISVKELNKSKVATSSNGVTESVDTNINVPEFGSITETVLVDNNGSISPDTDILTVFENTQITVYGEEMLTDENVEYGQITFDFESVDLGESIKGKEKISYDGQEQVAPDIVNSDGSIEESAQEDTSTTVESEYEVPEVTASTIENLTADEIEEAYISTSENSPLSDEVLDLDDVETDEFNSMFT